MANANVMSGANRLKHSFLSLQENWENTKATWNDAVRRDFEERHITPLRSAVEAAIGGMQSIAEILDKVRRDIADRESY